jgi:hypothetical protein
MTRCRVGESMASDYYEHAAECQECEAHEDEKSLAAIAVILAEGGQQPRLAIATENDVLRAAIAWWESRRPASYTAADHAANPQINCVSEAEKRLALAIARMKPLEPR